jgi:ribosomal protein L3 glutamine methyltransferase
LREPRREGCSWFRISRAQECKVAKASAENSAKNAAKSAAKTARKTAGKTAGKTAAAKTAAKSAAKPSLKLSSRSPPRELSTILDFIRYAASRFAGAKLGYGQGTFDPVEEATFLVAEALGLPLDGIDPFLPARMTADECRHIFALIDKRIRLRIPAAYLLNCAYLQGTRFYVDERVIVPRSYLAELLYGDPFNGEEPLLDRHAVTRVLEVCTGSGCLAVLACDVFPNAQVDATDISAAALEVAAINIAEHDLGERVTLRNGDLFEPIGNATYDLILANPPYVTAKAITGLPPEFAHEPRLALAGGADGMDIVRRIVAEAGRHLNEDGGLLCEVGRGRPVLEHDHPAKDFLWLDTAESAGEVFWMPTAALQA